MQRALSHDLPDVHIGRCRTKPLAQILLPPATSRKMSSVFNSPPTN